MDPAIERIISAIDPQANVSVSAQLRGALEFGIASGDIAAGQKLPSVRALGKHLGISPVTVSSVYAALQSAGHIEGRAGSGTFVGASANLTPRDTLLRVDAAIADLIRLGQSCGMGPSDLALRMSMVQSCPPQAAHLLMVGNFHDATESYAADIRAHLAEGDTVTAITLDQIEHGLPQGIDMIIAPRTLLPRLREIAPHATLIGLTLIPNEATRIALATIPPEAKVAAYSYFPGFAPIMKAGIKRFAPHVPDLTMVLRDDPDEDARIASAEVLIYATGADYLRERLRPGQIAFEYRHTPDPQAIRSELLPAVTAARRPLPRQKDITE
ncbi:hypothetical protein P775_06580 [Puniceibacterium antarcticum]|uniref:HTH gntR-type domain-containing protein n=1 Tax=Puniceibacterium antarcticum TaxID=1206336 RepID=A0A2G8RHL1_9RHOB|nr:hypothetical protein P775_06580 [Puniceibacterium antarcticum]